MNNELKIPAGNVDLRKCKSQACKCGSIIWIQGIVLKEIPGLLIGKPGKAITQIGILFCSDCGDLHPDHLTQIQEPSDPGDLPS